MLEMLRRSSEISYSGKLAVVTGAGSGIGRAVAEALLERGARVVACDKNPDGIDSLRRRYDGVVMDRLVDVGSREEMRRFADEVLGAHGAPDILVNNAGVAVAGGMLETSLDNWDWVLKTNLYGVVHGCHLFAPEMARAGRGHIVNLSSMLGYFATHDALAYCTSKYAVLGLSEALRQELEPEGVGVSAICPGMINTGIIKASRFVGKRENLQGTVQRSYEKRNFPPERVADAVLSAIDHNRAIVPVTLEAWTTYVAKRISPALANGAGRVLGALARRG